MHLPAGPEREDQQADQEGNHWVYNNRTDGWTVKLCTGANGTGCGTALRADYLLYANLSPINSILIEP